MVAEAELIQYSFIAPALAERSQKHKFPAYYMWVVLHELFGHGTGKMLCEIREVEYNFHAENLLVDPVTGKGVTGWYKLGQTWTGVFGDLATTVDECRAELFGAYLMDDAELLGCLVSLRSRIYEPKT